MICAPIDTGVTWLIAWYDNRLVVADLDHGVDDFLHLFTLYTLPMDIFMLHPPPAHPAHACLNNETIVDE